MKTFRNYILDEFGIEMPQGEISGAWFSQNGFPMIVACTCCGMTMSAPSALIDRDGQVYCSGCGGDPTKDESLPEDAEDLGDWDVDESAYDPYLGCDVWETEPLDDMW